MTPQKRPDYIIFSFTWYTYIVNKVLYMYLIHIWFDLFTFNVNVGVFNILLRRVQKFTLKVLDVHFSYNWRC